MIASSQQAASVRELDRSTLGADAILGHLYEKAERGLREALTEKGVEYNPARAMVAVRIDYLYTKEDES